MDVCAALAGLGFGAVLAAVILGESRGSLAAPGGLLSAAGRLAAFAGTYLMLVMVVLIARLPWLESSVGQDRLVRWHRQLAPWAIGLITAHVVLITLGYAQAASTGALHQLWVLVTSYRDMLAAAVGFGLLIMAGVSSYRHVRRRLRYETWWVIHLYLYLGLALAFAHQIFTGVSFIGHPLVRALWIVVWAATAGLVLVYRVAQPAWRSLRHQLRVVEVRQEAPGVVSVVCRGRHLDRLAVSGGQFFHWHFLTREMWWQGHPYSLSALPRPPYIRVTIKGLGDQSRARPACARAPGWPSKAPTARSPITRAFAKGSRCSPPGSASPRCARCSRTCRPGSTWWSWSARLPLRTWCTGTRWPPWSGSVMAVCRRSSGHGTRSGSTPGCFGRSCPISPTATCTSAGPAGSPRRSPTPRSTSGRTRSRSTQRRSVSDARKGRTADA